jgi:hypothetical protein
MIVNGMGEVVCRQPQALVAALEQDGVDDIVRRFKRTTNELFK